MHSIIHTPSFYWTKFGAIRMPILHFVKTCMTKVRNENSHAPPMRHHGFEKARRVSDTYKMCDCFILSCSKKVLIYRNIHFSEIHPRISKLQQKFTLFWIFPRMSVCLSVYHFYIRFLDYLVKSCYKVETYKNCIQSKYH